MAEIKGFETLFRLDGKIAVVTGGSYSCFETDARLFISK
jgi:hypothetical protein